MRRHLFFCFAVMVGTGQALAPSSFAQTSNDFDLFGTPWVGASNTAGSEPVVLFGGFSNNYLQLMPDVNSLLNTAAFDQTNPGQVVSTVNFDFRLADEATYTGGQRADGFSVSLVSPSLYGTSGALGPAGITNWERPQFAGSFAIGFDIYEGGNNNVFSLNLNGAQLATSTINDSVFQLTSGAWNTASINVTVDDSNIVMPTTTVSMTILPNIDGGGGAPVTVFDNVQINGIPPIGGRVAFGGRTGGERTSVDLDNVSATFVAVDPGAGVPIGTPTGPVMLGPNLADGTRNAYQLVTTSGGFTFDEARFDAQRHTYNGAQGRLVDIHGWSENAFAAGFGGDMWIGLTDSDLASTIDGFNYATLGTAEGTFQWTSGQPVTFTAWGGGEPNNAGTLGEDAAHIRGDSLWNDHNAGSTLGQNDHRLAYVIEYPVAEPGVAENQQPRLLPKLGPILPDGTRNAYEVVQDGKTWDQARADAEAENYLGVQGHLVTVGSDVENAHVDTLVGDAWIGLTDATVPSSLDGFDPTTLGTSEQGNTSGSPDPPAGQPPVAGERGFGWAWVTGEPLVYQNWGGGEPNDSGGEDAAHIRGDGMWNDHKAGTTIGDTSDHFLPSVIEYDLGIAAQPGFTTRMVQIGPGDGSADEDLNRAGEALSVMSGFGAVGSGTQYNVTTDVTTQSFEVDFAGGGGNFPTNNAYPNGLNDDTQDDFAVRATSQVHIPEGNWTIAFASDDGGYLHLEGVPFVAQINTNGDNKPDDDMILYDGTRGHSATLGHISVPAGGVNATLDAMFFERAGGDSFEISIAPGHWPGLETTSFALLMHGQYGWSVEAQDPVDNFNVRMIQLDPAAPDEGDNQINNAQEAIAMALTATGPGPIAVPGINSTITTFVDKTSPWVDFGGGGGDFNSPTLNYPDGRTDPGDDFLVAAQAYLFLDPGTWTIAFGSDDGGVIQLTDPDGDPFAFDDEINTNGDGVLDDVILFDAPRGHDQTLGVFTVDEPTLLFLNSLFFERGGGDSFEISIAAGAQSDFDVNNFFTLRDRVLPGVRVGLTPEAVLPGAEGAIPEPSTWLLLGLGGIGMLLWRRRRSHT